MGGDEPPVDRERGPAEPLLDQARERVDASRQIEHALGLQMTFTRNALLLRDDATIESIFRENNRFRDTFDRLEAAAPPDQRETIQRLRTTQDKVMATVARIAALIREDKADEAMELHLSEGYPLYREIATLVTRAVRNEEAGMGQLREGVEATYRRALLLTGGFAAASIVLALVLGFVISWSFILPVREAEGFLGQVAKGDFGASIDVPNRDEFGALARPDERDEPRASPALRRAAAGRAPAPGAQRRARAGQPGQVRLPRQHEPRAPHADERDPRLHRDDPRRAVRRGAARDPGAGVGHPHLRQAAPRPDQQRARPLQDRGRAHGAGPRRVRGRGRREHREALAALAGRDQGARLRHRRGRPTSRSPWATASGSPSA